MIDFSDFNKVLDAANSALEEMKTKTLAAKKAVEQVEQNAYKPVYKFFEEASKITDKIGIPNKKFQVNVHVPEHIYETVEFCVYDGYDPRFGQHPEIGIHINGVFLRWFNLFPELSHTKRCTTNLGKAFVDQLINDWPFIEEDVANSFKNMVTEAMADKIREEEKEYADAKLTLLSKRSEEE